MMLVTGTTLPLVHPPPPEGLRAPMAFAGIETASKNPAARMNTVVLSPRISPPMPALDLALTPVTCDAPSIDGKLTGGPRWWQCSGDTLYILC